MRKIAFILTVLLFSCCSPRIVEKIQVEKVTEYRDSTVWRDTTIYVPIPLESGNVIVSTRDTARRETSVAKAEAWVDSVGFLNLNLENKKAALPYVVKIPSRTIWVSVSSTDKQTLTQTVFVEKKLSIMQKIKISAFWWLILSVVLLLLWTFRKSIIKLCGIK